MLAIEFPDYVKVRQWMEAGQPAILVEIVAAAGSTPRERGAAMAVTAEATAGTIGGGQLEFLAIAEARKLIGSGEAERVDVVPLGPEIGQCCGGRVELHYSRIDSQVLERLRQAAENVRAQERQIYIFGAGHTGAALAEALGALPYRTHVVDTRPEMLEGLAGEFEKIATALPEEIVAGAVPGSAFVVMTHEHSLDFLITATALNRGDAAYCGMIGSATKRQVFINWLADHDYPREIADGLVCPIGGAAVRDKRPAIIAALTAAEIVMALHASGSEEME